MRDKEYIERGALVEHIKNMPWKITPAAEISKGIFLQTVEDAPAADVVEVVRCKYCKYVSDLGMSGLYCDHPDNRNPCGCRPNDFCNEGKRKEQT